ncbi:MAG: class I SAM-dependent methyltransferase [Candidatus Fermentibacteria bacterium]|nr:class I SAM-dependent methyltransferase [Candidatus Fermentibacteria bacterium]
MTGKDVLEVGIGVGRMARQILKRGCGHLTGLDISPKTIAVAQKDLAEFPNLELTLADITEFRRNLSFDLAYSVLTFMHVEDKPAALENIVASLRPGGSIVLSIDNSSSNSVDFGKWTVAVSRWLPAQYVAALKDLGCDVSDPVPLIDSWISQNGKRSETYGQCVATLIKAVKRQVAQP